MAASVYVLSERTVTLKTLAAESEMEDLLQEIHKDSEKVYDFSGLVSGLATVVNTISLYHIVSLRFSLRASMRNAQEKLRQATVLLHQKSHASLPATNKDLPQFLSEKSVSLKTLAAESEIEDLYKQIQTSSGYRYIDFFYLLSAPAKVIREMCAYRIVSVQVTMTNAIRKTHATMTLLQNMSTAALQARVIAFSDSLTQMQNRDFIQEQKKIQQQFAQLNREIAFFSKMQLKADALLSLSVSKISLKSVTEAYQSRLQRLETKKRDVRSKT